MSRRCDITGIGRMVGNHVSHANNKTKRTFLPNVRKKTFFVASLNKKITLNISSKGLRIIDKAGGIDAFLTQCMLQDCWSCGNENQE